MYNNQIKLYRFLGIFIFKEVYFTVCDTYDITYSDLNPTLYFAGKRTVTESNFSHTHDAPELFIVLSGELAIWMDGTTTPLTAGDIVCVPSHMPHRTLPTVHDNPAILFFTSFSNFHFKGMEPNHLDFPGGSSVLHTDGLVRQDITNLCLHMISERYSNQVGQYFMQKAYLTQLLMTIIRQITVPPKQSCSPVTFETHHKTYVVSEIRQYLSSHYAEKISLDLIARNMYLSSAYISKIFKEETGEAPINYLIKMRLERARIQLESDNGQSIKAISNSVGYDDVYYFSKLFKKYYGMSPVHYRSKYRKVV